MAKKQKIRSSEIIKRVGGTVFSLSAQQLKSSPLDVEGMDVPLSTQDIVEAVRESRQRVRGVTAQSFLKNTRKS